MAFDKSKQAFGALFKNDRKQKDTHPDYQGNIEITPEFLAEIQRNVGKKFQLSGWIKQGGKGAYISLSLQPPWEGAKSGGSSAPASRNSADIPFAPER